MPLTSPYSLALDAALRAAADQDYPQSALYVVATPIGNLADISLRALSVLQRVDRLACEDTRHSAALLRAYGLNKPLLALHQHNEQEAAAKVIAHLRAGERVAYLSDAGTPGVSDPGSRLVNAVQEQGLRVVPLPGASCVTALVSAAGLSSSDDEWANQGFVFVGFLPPKGQARAAAINELAAQQRAVVWMEAPHRLHRLAEELRPLGQRRLSVGRELSKRFEQLAHMPCAQLADWLAADTNRARGEFVLALAPQPLQAETEMSAQHQKLMTLLLQELSIKSASSVAATLTGHPRKHFYDWALQRQAR